MTSGSLSDRGAVLVLMTLFWLIIAGVLALVVDLGLVRQRRAEAQLAVDAGVLASLPELAAGDSPMAQQLALAYVTNNGFDVTDVQVQVPPTRGRHIGDTSCIEVFVSDDLPSLFSSVLGVSGFRASARAVGCATTSGAPGPPALFAGAHFCAEKSLKVSSSTTTIIGGVHSNGSIELSGSDNAFLGEFEWSPASYYLNSGANNWFDRASSARPPISWPVHYDIADFMPGGAHAQAAAAAGDYYSAGDDDMDLGWLIDNGAYEASTHVLRSGIYYTSAKIDLSDSDITIAGRGVTLVSSGGEINLNGSNHEMRPYLDDLLIFGDYQKEGPLSSESNCDSAAASLSGSGSRWEGIIYVPRGQVKLAGSLNATLSGAVLGHTIELSGQDLSIDSSGLGTPQVAVSKLVE